MGNPEKTSSPGGEKLDHPEVPALQHLLVKVAVRQSDHRRLLALLSAAATAAAAALLATQARRHEALCLSKRGKSNEALNQIMQKS